MLSTQKECSEVIHYDKSIIILITLNDTQVFTIVKYSLAILESFANNHGVLNALEFILLLK